MYLKPSKTASGLYFPFTRLGMSYADSRELNAIIERGMEAVNEESEIGQEILDILKCVDEVEQESD